MPIFTVYEPPEKRPEERRGPDRFVFVRDGFYVWAFLLTPLWLLWRRLWLVFIGYLVLNAALVFGLGWLKVPIAATWTIGILLSFLIGLEAGTLWRWTLRRRKWRDAGVVSADTREAAERRFFDAWTGGDEAAEAMPPPSSSFLPAAGSAGYRALPVRHVSAQESGVVGLFPEPGTR